MIDFRDLIYNRNNYRADGKELMRVRLEVVTADGKTFWVHANDHGLQQTRIVEKAKGE